MSAIKGMSREEIRRALVQERRKVTGRLIELRRHAKELHQSLADCATEISECESRLRMIDHSEGTL